MAASFTYDRELMKQWGGYVQGQYFFTNQWYMNIAWGYGAEFRRRSEHLRRPGRPAG